VLRSCPRHTPADSEAQAGGRVRLVRGGCVAAFDHHEVDLNYVRCTNALLSGDGYPMFATHDLRLVRIVAERARWYDRKPGTYEYQMLFGVRQDEQRRLAREGETVRVHVPYGSQWSGYLMRRLAERAAASRLFARALVSHS
jgi:proline dehydrogenase